MNKTVDVYEVYCTDKEGRDCVFTFMNEEVFESSIGNFVREDYTVDLKCYSNVLFSEEELNLLQAAGWIY